MKTAIYGAGALGTILGAYLSKAGVDTVLVNRNKEHIDMLNQTGARVVGEVEFSQQVKAITPDEMEGLFDVIFLMTKQTENASVGEFLLGKLKEDGIICTTQNGLPEVKLMEIFGNNRVVGCTVMWGATLISPGVAKLTSNVNNMSFSIGSLVPGNTVQLQRIKKILENMCPVYIEDNFIGARWSKLIINAAFSGLSTVFNLNFGEVAKNRMTRAIAQRIIKETIDVAKAADILVVPVQGRDVVKLMDYNGVIKKRIAYHIIPIAMKNHSLIRSGMLGDIDRNRKTEVDAINGVVCEFGRRYSCPTPFNDRVVDIIHRIEEGEAEMGIGNIGLFDDLM